MGLITVRLASHVHRNPHHRSPTPALTTIASPQVIAVAVGLAHPVDVTLQITIPAPAGSPRALSAPMRPVQALDCPRCAVRAPEGLGPRTTVLDSRPCLISRGLRLEVICGGCPHESFGWRDLLGLGRTHGGCFQCMTLTCLWMSSGSSGMLWISVVGLELPAAADAPQPLAWDVLSLPGRLEPHGTLRLSPQTLQ